jgi:two-component system chemotaxis response regulator CheB
MTVEASPGQASRIVLNQNPAENFCRPAVDPMLRSLVPVYGGAVLAVILTGMGHDGLRGCEEIVSAGGSVIAQDEATSIVWGMPGSVANAGLCSALLPLNEIGKRVRRIAQGGGLA